MEMEVIEIRSSNEDLKSNNVDEENVFKKPINIKEPEISFKKPTNIKAEDHAFKVPKMDLPILRKKVNKPKATSDNDSPATHLPESSSAPKPDGEEVKKETKLKKSGPENLAENGAIFQYKEPSWSTVCSEDYSFEVLKNGVINTTIPLTGKSFLVFGRLTNCDGVLQHQSVSRYHAVVQFRADIPNKDNNGTSSGCFLYDLGSTHGTFLNKMPVKPKVYYRIRVGHMIKFGKSSRMFILQGPNADQEEESEETVTELIEQRKAQETKLKALEENDYFQDEENSLQTNQNSTASDGDSGIDWGMGEDAVEETDMSVNPYALSTPNEDTYFDDPKKTLRGYFEREGCELEYNVEEKGYSHFVCKVQLPIDSPTGQPIIAEASVKGKKKDAVVQCALEACRILDRNGVLRQSQHKSRKRKEKNWEENDFYDSDEDTFLDRTGTVENKRRKRMEKANKAAHKADTYDTLNEQLQEVNNKIKEIENNLSISEEQEKAGEDSLEAYMNSVSAGVIHDKKAISAMKIQLSQFRLERLKLEKLVSIAKPASLPCLSKLEEAEVKPQSKKQLPMVGSMRGGRKKFKFLSVSKKVTPIKTNISSSEKLENEDINNVSSSSAKEANNVTTQRAELDVSQNKSEKFTPKQEETEPPKIEKDTPVLSEQADNENNSNSTTSDVVNDKKEPKESNCFEEIKKRELKRKQKLLKVREKMSYCYDDSNPDYAMWMPPKGQDGDGKTHLNEKFGY